MVSNVFKMKQDCSYQGEALNVPTAFEVLWSSNNIKKLKVIKQNDKIKQNKTKFEIFYENHPPTRHLKYKRIDFAPCNKPIMSNKLLFTNFERFPRRINSPLTRY